MSSHGLNSDVKPVVQIAWNDHWAVISHNVNMAQLTGHDWFLREWAAAARKTQADFQRALELHKNTANRLWHGEQPYRRDYLNGAAAWLEIRPYELLMRPEDAYAIRRLRETAAQIVKETALEENHEAPADNHRRTG